MCCARGWPRSAGWAAAPRAALRSWERGWVDARPVGLGQRESERWVDRCPGCEDGGGLPRKPQAAFPSAPPCHCLLPPRPAGPSSVKHPQLMLGGPQVGPRTTCSRFRWPHRPVVAAPGRGRRVQERVSRQGRRPERAHEHTSSRPSRRLPQDASSRTSQLHVFREANPHVF